MSDNIEEKDYDKLLVHEIFLSANKWYREGRNIIYGDFEIYSDKWEPYHISIKHYGKPILVYNPYVSTKLELDDQTRLKLETLVAMIRDKDITANESVNYRSEL